MIWTTLTSPATSLVANGVAAGPAKELRKQDMNTMDGKPIDDAANPVKGDSIGHNLKEGIENLFNRLPGANQTERILVLGITFLLLKEVL